MDPARVSSKHQVVIPKRMRAALGVKAGDQVFFVSRNDIVYILPKGKSWVQALKGRAAGPLKYPKRYLKEERSSW